MNLARITERVRKFELPRHLVTAMELAGALADSLPNRNSTPTQAVLKTLASINTVRKVLWPAGANPVAVYAAQHGLVEQRSEQFVRLFWDTDLSKRFVIGKIRVTDYMNLIEARGPLGHLAFTKYDFADTHEPTFFMGPGLHLTSVVDDLWESYAGRLQVALTSTPGGSSRSEFVRFAAPDPHLFGGARARMDALVARHERFRARGKTRAYCFYGEPGTGKSTAAALLAARLGARTLKLDAPSLGHASVKEMAFLLENVAPDFVIIDDVDKVEPGNALATVLEIVARFKAPGSRASVALTANRIGGFDKGMLRPGRVDTWVEFRLPNGSERAEVLRRYAPVFGAKLSPKQLTTLTKATAGLSQDYLREIVDEFGQSGDLGEAVALIATMKRLAEAADDEAVKVAKAKAAAAPPTSKASP